MKNNIKELLKINGMSINELSKRINKDYPTTHALVNRKSLATTPLDTLVKVAEVLNVDIKTLYEDTELIRDISTNYVGGIVYHSIKNLENELKDKFSSNGIDCDIEIAYKLELKGTINDKMTIHMNNYLQDDRIAKLTFRTDSHSFIFKDRFIDKVSSIVKSITDISEDTIFKAFDLEENEKTYYCTNLIKVTVVD